MTPLAHAPGDDLDWLAFRYVAGELDGSELIAFEQLLDHDQAAREAVAHAVLLLEGVVEAAPVVRSSLRWRARARRAVVVALASAACLALAVTPWLIEVRHSDDAIVAHSTTPGTGSAVALAWSGLFQEAAESSRPDDMTAALDGVDTDAVTAVGTVADAGDTVDGLPDWLIEAAALRPSS